MQTLLKILRPERSGLGSGDETVAFQSSAHFGLLVKMLPVSPWQRNVLSLLWFIGTCAWFWIPLGKLLALALENEHFSHVLLIPLVSLYLLFLNRTAILTSKEWSPAFGGVLLAVGGVFSWFANAQEGATDQLSAGIMAFVLLCWGLFLFSFGVTCFQKNAFALLFFLFIIPLPSVVLDAIIGFLQRSSAEASAVIFSALGIPVFRQGFMFSLSHFTIHVAEECSGIRSFLSLLITSVVAGYWFLRSGWARVVLTATVVPLAIIKNAFRIVGLAMLANYVDPAYITNSLLHKAGGIPLFFLSLVVLSGVGWLLRRMEQKPGSKLTQ